MSALEVITPRWSSPARVRAAFILRTGGVSTRPFDSLNLGAHVGDAPEAVAENRLRVHQHLKLPVEPAWLQQAHGANVVDLDMPLRQAPADASVTRSPGRVCAILVADCMPVLFAARDGSVVGAAHAGWRGLAAGVLEKTVAKIGVEPQRLLAWMGPAISQKHFEVGDDVRAAFLAEDIQSAAAFKANSRGRWQCDLYALARRRLSALGVSAISGGGWCTYADAARFFSFRRDGQCGRMAALIWME